MVRRKLLTLLFGVALLVALVALPTASASAETRTLLVTLQDGQQLTVTVDVAPGTPLDQIQIPGVNGVIVSVSEASDPAAAPAPTATTTAPAPSTTPTQTTPSTTPTTPSTTPSTTPTTPSTTPNTTPTTKPSTTPTTPTTPSDDDPVGGDPSRGPRRRRTAGPSARPSGRRRTTLRLKSRMR
ncbi:MAG: hypothetical protein R2736_16755 [Solirubrobacterales bacterium]